MAKTVLVKPVITEKTEKLSEGLNQYSFIVDKKANKIEIKEAIETLYSVNVSGVNTMIMPSKAKNRNTKSRVVKGRISGFKKAIITLAEGEVIDLYGDI